MDSGPSAPVKPCQFLSSSTRPSRLLDSSLSVWVAICAKSCPWGLSIGWRGCQASQACSLRRFATSLPTSWAIRCSREAMASPAALWNDIAVKVLIWQSLWFWGSASSFSIFSYFTNYRTVWRSGIFKDWGSRIGFCNLLGTNSKSLHRQSVFEGPNEGFSLNLVLGSKNSKSLKDPTFPVEFSILNVVRGSLQHCRTQKGCVGLNDHCLWSKRFERPQNWVFKIIKHLRVKLSTAWWLVALQCSHVYQHDQNRFTHYMMSATLHFWQKYERFHQECRGRVPSLTDW